MIKKGGIKIVCSLCLLVLMLSVLAVDSYANTGFSAVPGKVYEFEKDSHYEFSDSNEYTASDETETYGSFMIGGNVSGMSDKNGITTYEVENGNLSFFYNYGDILLVDADEDLWHSVEDKSKKIDGLKLEENILSGAIILQTSTDGLNWVNAVSITDAFAKVPVRTEAIYETADVQLINGCYYRLIVAYKLRIRTEDSNILFINTDKYEYKKCAEVYEFYAYTDTENINSDGLEKTYNLGTKVRVSDFDSYSGEEPITKKDSHYGWDIGNFFVSGYTADTKGSDGNIVFLKNVGDKVTLWFRMNQDINKLDGNEKLSVTADEAGSDRYFETPVMDFGKGTLIIRYTDHRNVKAEPVIYTNYLEANTSIGADTKVQLFEEGDYEVALNYQITDDRLLIDKHSHYRIFFKFSIRNGNCMVYPFDVVTGSELTNSSMTENGFRLDLAKSRYLRVNLKREIMAEGADGLVEDTRFNGPAKDGAEYTDEGIYTITVANEYTGQLTVKKIYVGTDKVLKAHMTTGLSVPEINDLVAQGATIEDDGTILIASIAETVQEESEPEKPESSVSEQKPVVEQEEISAEKEETERKTPVIPIIAAAAVCCAAIIAIITIKKNKKTPVPEEDERSADK